MSKQSTTAEPSLEFVAVAEEGEIQEGSMRAVTVNGKRVVLAMVEGVSYALGAVCTHERANLDEGTLMGHELYCPLHFSCFDVRTGEALAPPAERATTVYAVKIEDGTVYVSAGPVDPDSQMLAAAAGGVITPTTVGAEADGAAPTGETAATPAVDVPVVTPRPTTMHQNLIARAQDLPGLEAAAQALGTALRPIRESPLGGRAFDLLHGRLTGHALHPALSDLPIGLWVGAVILHVAAYPKAALILAIGGVISGIATALTGVADWTVSDGHDRRLGLLHGLLQTVALAVAIASVVLQLAGPLLVAQILLAIALVISASSAYLGGHLVLGRGVMVDHTAWTRGPRSWVRAIEVTELGEGQAKAVTIEGRQILVSMIDGAVSAIENVCTHAGGPLSLGTIENGVVKCPWHGSCFRLRDGAVVKGPASHPQPMLEVRVTDGWVEVRGRGRW